MLFRHRSSVKMFYDWDWKGAEAGIRRALELNPGELTAHQSYGALLTALGRFHEAERQLALFLEAHPESADARFYRGVSLLMLGRTAEAAPPLMAAIEIGESRTREEARWYLALGFLKQDEPGKALEQLDVLATSPGHRRSEADKLRQEVRTRSPGQQ